MSQVLRPPADDPLLRAGVRLRSSSNSLPSESVDTPSSIGSGDFADKPSVIHRRSSKTDQPRKSRPLTEECSISASTSSDSAIDEMNSAATTTASSENGDVSNPSSPRRDPSERDALSPTDDVLLEESDYFGVDNSLASNKSRISHLKGRLKKARKHLTCAFPRRGKLKRTGSEYEVFVSAVDLGNPSEVGHSCRGSINLQDARILSDKETNNIIISAASQTFHLKAQNEGDRERWISALNYSRIKAIKQAESDEDDDAARLGGELRAQQTLETTHAALETKLADLRIAQTLMVKHSDELLRCVNDVDSGDYRRAVAERAALLKITSAAVAKACEEFVELSDKGTKRLGKLVEAEEREKTVLHEQLETLAKQHSNLERAATVSYSQPGNSPLSVYSDMEDEFHDAAETLSIFGKTSRGGSESGGDLDGKENDNGSITPPRRAAGSDGVKKAPEFNNNGAVAIFSPPVRKPLGRKRRTTIPDRPDLPINLWSIMKNCIGKELSKIPMPVNFSEPISVLQRITEDLEYANLLEEAASLDSLQQMCYVAAYAVSNYSTTGNRTNKPFNPLLGETYECDRTDDLGWRSIAEQVSHHPPAAAQHAEGRGWSMYQDFTMTSRFRGKFLSVIPVGWTHVYFPGTTNHYTYKKVTTTVHNIIVGKLWIDNHGDMEITNHGTGEKCQLKFIPYSYFSREPPKRIYGVVSDARGTPRYVVQGMWDQSVEMAKVTRVTGSGDKAKIETDEKWKRIWGINSPMPNADKMHNFTRLTLEMNEMEDGIAPTDSRMRPDQRLMEDGRWDESNKKKLEIEEKQRTVRRQREAEQERAVREGKPYEEYTPAWFVKVQDELTGSLIHKFKHEYWQAKDAADWSKCPQIY